jgi:hypothetical protein
MGITYEDLQLVRCVCVQTLARSFAVGRREPANSWSASFPSETTPQGTLDSQKREWEGESGI